MPDRALTQEDASEVWLVQSVLNGKQADHADGAKSRAKVEVDTSQAFEKAQGAAQRAFDKAIDAATLKRDAARNKSQADLDKLIALVGKAQSDLDVIQERKRQETGAIIQLLPTGISSGGRTNI